ARRQTGRRGVIEVETLLEIGSAEGAAALGLDEWPDVEVDLGHPQLRAVDEGGLYEGLVLGATGAVFLNRSAQ
ncbi:MAG TPA: hypothetical protein VHC01_15530, partial [Gaiellaceae bacterium]|nr:hypothetical protein [Gaiellaceae bacterium]